MQRLIKGKGLNSAKEYDRIFFERQKKGVDLFDLKRWKKLIEYFKGGKLIDLGALDSLVCPLAKEKFGDKAVCCGIDQSETAIFEMNKKYQNSKKYSMDWFRMDIYKTSFFNNEFDYAVMGEVLEHLEEPHKAIDEAFRILKPKGVLAISVPFNEAIEPGAKDKDRHIWSFDKQDIYNLTKDYSTIIKMEIMGSQKKPYKYNFPNLLAWVKKDDTK